VTSFDKLVTSVLRGHVPPAGRRALQGIRSTATPKDNTQSLALLLFNAMRPAVVSQILGAAD
jgi:hypothetical protein